MGSLSLEFSFWAELIGASHKLEGWGGVSLPRAGVFLIFLIWYVMCRTLISFGIDAYACAVGFDRPVLQLFSGLQAQPSSKIAEFLGTSRKAQGEQVVRQYIRNREKADKKLPTVPTSLIVPSANKTTSSGPKLCVATSASPGCTGSIVSCAGYEPSRFIIVLVWGCLGSSFDDLKWS